MTEIPEPRSKPIGMGEPKNGWSEQLMNRNLMFCLATSMDAKPSYDRLATLSSKPAYDYTLDELDTALRYGNLHALFGDMHTSISFLEYLAGTAHGESESRVTSEQSRFNPTYVGKELRINTFSDGPLALVISKFRFENNHYFNLEVNCCPGGKYINFHFKDCQEIIEGTERPRANLIFGNGPEELDTDIMDDSSHPFREYYKLRTAMKGINWASTVLTQLTTAENWRWFDIPAPNHP